MLLACMKCTSVLDKARIEDVEVDLCPTCGGLWLDHGEIDRLGKKMGSEIDRLRKLLAPRAGEAPPVPSDVTTVCPACTAKVREVKLGPVTIDICTKCKGVFLDRGELDAALKVLKDQKTTLGQLIATAGAEAERG
jgi:uncharacterized protein